MPNKKKPNGAPIILALLLVLCLVYVSVVAGRNDIPYSELISKFNDQQIESFELNFGNGKLTYIEKGSEEKKLFTVPSIDLFIYDTRDAIEKYNEAHPGSPMKFDYVQSTSIVAELLSWLPVLLMFAMFIVFFMTMNQQGGGKMGNITKARVYQENEGRKATFADVAGCDEEKEELEEIIQYLKDPKKFNSLGAKIPHGVLLVGPPGTGKTLLARAVAGEANVPFFSISGSDFVELYVGVGAGRVRDLFDRAKRARPSIIFIDEIDAVGRQRGAGLGGGHDEREQTLNQLLVEMDGFGVNDGVIVMAATNRADILDTALLRPGRFDRQVYVGVPDVKGREEILKVHAKGKPLGPDVDLKTIAQSTPGFTGADLENLLNEAALLAARRNKKAITHAEIKEASIKVAMGPEKKSRVVTDKDRRLTAYHEAGHAIANHIQNPDVPVYQVSIIPRGSAGGFTWYLPTEDTNYTSRKQMFGEIVSAMGGRVAESIVLDDISTGASQDLKQATSIARDMVTRYGFSEKLGPVVYGDSNEVFLGRDFTHTRNYSERIASDIDEEIRAILEKGYEECERILNENRDKLDKLASALLEKEKIEADEFLQIMKDSEPEAETGIEMPVVSADPAELSSAEE